MMNRMGNESEFVEKKMMNRMGNEREFVEKKMMKPRFYNFFSPYNTLT